MRVFFASILLFAFAYNAQAATYFQGVDISPVVEYYAKRVVVLNKSVTTYNWSNRPVEPKTWGSWIGSVFSQNSNPQWASPLDHIRDWANVFWADYGVKAGGNLYGYGLYLAVDPIVTRYYADQENWQLLSIELPVGSRLIDVAINNGDDDFQKAESAPVQQIESQFDCRDTGKIDDFFYRGGVLLAEKCRALSVEIFRNILKIDAVAYFYPSVFFTSHYACGKNRNVLDRAFVLLGGNRLKAENVRIYDKDSQGSLEDRIRIQTLMSKYADDGNPIQDESANRTLWPALVGRAKSPDIATWLRANRFGCGGTLPYRTSTELSR